MSIIIANLGTTSNPHTPNECDYVIRINSEKITQFIHDRDDGLAECLRRASIAVTRQLIEDLAEEIDSFASTEP